MPSQINRLSAREKAGLLDTVWESLEADSGPRPDGQRAELDYRSAWREQNPCDGSRLGPACLRSRNPRRWQPSSGHSMPRVFRERWDSASHPSHHCRPKQNAPDSFESGAYVDQPSPKCCSIRRLIGRRKSVNGYFVPLSQTLPPLRLGLHFEPGRGPVQFIGEIHVDRLAVLRHMRLIATTFPSRLSTSSIGFAEMRFSETMVWPGSPSTG